MTMVNPKASLTIPDAVDNKSITSRFASTTVIRSSNGGGPVCGRGCDQCLRAKAAWRQHHHAVRYIPLVADIAVPFGAT